MSGNRSARAPLGLGGIRECFEGQVPPIIATCAPDGTPNVGYLSQIQYIDEEHIALTFQFFNKTRENILANPRATVGVFHPLTGAQYLLSVEYLRTETEGPLFERMKARLAGIASHTGMAKVFKLRGSDIYRVHRIEAVKTRTVAVPAGGRNLLDALRAAANRIATCCDVWAMPELVLDALTLDLGVTHAMLSLIDERRERLFVVASRGYAAEGVGSEIPIGTGMIGICAKEKTPIRITHFTRDYQYTQAVRAALDDPDALETRIPWPGLPEPQSQLAVPILLDDKVLGVMYVESEIDGRFGYDEEDALVTLAAQLGVQIRGLQLLADHTDHADAEPREPIPTSPPADVPACPPESGPPLVLKRYGVNDSVFLDDDYLIKGVAGAILWKLARDFAEHGRTDFSNRELRLDPSIKLPELSENLEARLILLQRRLAERSQHLRIEKTGRGRFRLCVTRPVSLVEA